MRKTRILALLLALCCLLSACGWTNFFRDAVQDSDGPLSAEGKRYSTIYYGQTVDTPSFDEIRYERPDVEALIADFGEVTSAVKDGAAAQEVIDAALPVIEEYYQFATMDSVAYIYYCSDTVENADYLEEYDYLENQQPLVSKAMEEFLVACANAPIKEALETLYFGEDALDEYVDYSVYTNETYVSLSRQENELVTQYMAEMEDPTITIDGQDVSLNDLLESGQYDESELEDEYLRQKTQTLGEIYIRLVKLRRQMAQTLGYESYADYAYAVEYERDFTPEQATDYLEAVKAQLVPIFKKYYFSGEWYYLSTADMDEDELTQALSDSMKLLGKPFTEAYGFMTKHGLYDASYNENKWIGSYMTYLNSYEAPYVYLCPEGTSSDFTTFAHEFGHFTDSFLNYDGGESIDSAEVFSQGLEYLALLNNRLDDEVRETLLEQVMFDSLQCFVFQSSYADFERQVYALDDEALTVEKVCDIALQVSKDYGYYFKDAEDYYRRSWTQIPHFFNAPYYIISYCVSNDAAMQIFELEYEKQGNGRKTYLQMIENSHTLSFCEMLEDAKLNVPFEQTHMESLAQIFRKILLGRD